MGCDLRQDPAQRGKHAGKLRHDRIHDRQHRRGLLHRLADRMTVQVNGACVGAGIELPSFTDHVIAAPETIFRLPELGMGLIPGAGGTVSITARIGRWRTAWWALTCRSLGVGTALRWGLVDEVTRTGDGQGVG